MQTNFTDIVDHDGSRTFAGRRTLGDPELEPETSHALNLGLTWELGELWSMNADLWRYAFEDVLRKDNAQAIVNADPFDARIERTSAGTISIVNVAFINADRIETSGLDLGTRGEFDSSLGTVSVWGEATWLFAYDVNNAGTSVNARGKLNRANVGAPNQQFKASIGATLSRSAWNLSGLLRHIGDYEDDLGGSIDSFTMLDLNAKFSFRDLLGGDTETWVRLGAANLLDEDPPYVAIAGSYDPRSADPRGRRLFVSVGLRL